MSGQFAIEDVGSMGRGNSPPMDDPNAQLALPGQAGGRGGKAKALNTFACVQVVAQQRRSRTMMMNGDPVYAFAPADKFVLTEPSSCIHVAIYDEGYVADTLLGQWTTTAKMLALDPRYADGGAGVDVDEGPFSRGLG